jgi:uncharacterized alkaline shock family protein YloU
VPDEAAPGRAVVTRRAIAEIVRAAVLGSYGVTGLAGGPLRRLLARLGLATSGLAVATAAERLTIDLDLTVAYGLPVAEVARQVDSAVRYRLRQALGREPDAITIRVGGLVCPPGSLPAEADGPSIGSSELADSGTDVA